MEKASIHKTIKEYLIVIVVTVGLTFGVLYFVQISKVVGNSMEPTYHNGNIILVDKFFYHKGTPKYNDIVVVEYQVRPGEDQIIKRVIGLPGDRIEMKSNQLYRNGELLKEDYINGPMQESEDFRYDIPTGKVFVMGDNRDVSIDSRVIGYIDIKTQIIGRVFFKVF